MKGAWSGMESTIHLLSLGGTGSSEEEDLSGGTSVRTPTTQMRNYFDLVPKVRGSVNTSRDSPIPFS